MNKLPALRFFGDLMPDTGSRIKTTDEQDVFEEYSSNTSTPAGIYVYGMDGLAAKIDPALGYFWYCKDQIGSTRQVTNVSGGADMKRDYWPFGGQVFNVPHWSVWGNGSAGE